MNKTHRLVPRDVQDALVRTMDRRSDYLMMIEDFMAVWIWSIKTEKDKKQKDTALMQLAVMDMMRSVLKKYE